jgi:hypothetical protein
MASRGKKKTTMAKLSRESRLRERRLEKDARKRARRDGAAPQLTRDTWHGPENHGAADVSASDPEPAQDPTQAAG